MKNEYGWEAKSIGELCEAIIDCVNKTAPTIQEPTPYRMIRTTNIKNGWIDTSSVKYVDETTYRKWIRRGAPRLGDIILSREAPLGEVGLLREDEGIFLGQRLVMYRANLKIIDNRFLLYSLLSHEVQGQIKSFGSGATVEHMRVPDCEKIKILVPPLPIQRNIASILSAYDDLIENNTRRIRILEQMAQTIYREWFAYFRFPGHEKTEFLNSPMGRIPEGWLTCAFTDISNILSGGTPRTSVPDYWDGEYLWFTPRDASGQLFVIGTEKRITSEGLKNCASQLYPKDTIFITARGTVGKLVLASEPMALNQSCYAVLGKQDYGQYFLFLMLQAQIDYLKRNTGGATFDTIVTDTFRRMIITKPPITIVKEFETRIKAIFDNIRILQFKNRNLRYTRDLLLPKLISGDLDVENIKIENS